MEGQENDADDDIFSGKLPCSAQQQPYFVENERVAPPKRR